MATPRDAADTIQPVSLRPPEKAAQFLASHGASSGIAFTPQEERAVVKRIDRRVLVLLLGAYFFQQLDKSTLGYVSIFGITQDANLVGRQYSWLGSILYLAQLVMQPLAAYILVKLPTGKVIAAAIFLWGSSLALMTVCTDFPSLLGLRFLLGAFESMIAPSCVAVTQMWWRRSEQTLRVGYWNAMNGVTFIVGSLFTYGLGHIESGVLFRYQIVFLFCGLLTVLYAGVVGLWMPDSPMEARYLSEREKLIAVERLRANQMGVSSGNWRWDHVVETMLDLKTWCWFVAIIAISIASGGISTFGNLIVKDFGYSPFETILFNIPFGVIQIFAIIGSAWLATKSQRKGLVIAGVSVLPATGTILMLTVSRQQRGVLLFGYYLVSCLAAITPLIYAWQAQNTAGDTKKKCTSAMVFIGMCSGNVIGPLLFSIDDAPLYRTGLISDLIMFATVGVLSALESLPDRRAASRANYAFRLIPLYLMVLNRRHAKKREELGKTAQVVDESMMGKGHMENSKMAGIEDAAANQRRVEEDNGLKDMTDLKNEDFIYVY
ncbi:hypothetical protein S7711_04673 [Stachybotrys chartarum IBT 7711]|uniref:Major facilitator superfamily (MFS) profile domain-containing protein n=1 Tax=Stachybotrys chartarum (strain CBS 109288 / IBT 7711) TaxID=1280523 RepID=A0A084B630_STACB|nr:hypothetical protein S7711_04673 [Stachybotrys chartarum IBT 7711]